MRTKHSTSYQHRHSPAITRITIRVQPNASASKVDGCHEGIWKIKIKAPPIEGAANIELITFLSKKLKIAKNKFQIISGHTSKIKILEIEESFNEIEGLLAMAQQQSSNRLPST